MFRLRLLWICFSAMTLASFAPSQTPAGAREKVIIDTDIGGAIDDAFAVALALKSPELDILGITTTTGDTELRADLVDRLLSEAGRQDIPVAAGKPTHPPVSAPFTEDSAISFSQSAYAKGGTAQHKDHPDAVDFTLETIRRYPHEVTLIAIGPLVNVGAMIDKDPTTFLQLKRVVVMGGSIDKWFNESEFAAPMPQVAEWNIVHDIPSAQKLFSSGVSIVMIPLDSTAHLSLDEVERGILFGRATPLTNALAALYSEWGPQTPILYDPMTIAYLLKPQICPVVPMHIRVDDKGMTREEEGAPNAMVCLHSSRDQFIRFYLERLDGTESGNHP